MFKPAFKENGAVLKLKFISVNTDFRAKIDHIVDVLKAYSTLDYHTAPERGGLFADFDVCVVKA